MTTNALGFFWSGGLEARCARRDVAAEAGGLPRFPGAPSYGTVDSTKFQAEEGAGSGRRSSIRGGTRGAAADKDFAELRRPHFGEYLIWPDAIV